MELSLFDLHCDTAYNIYHQKKSIWDNDLAVSLKKSEKYKKYCQVMAIWSAHSLTDDEAFEDFKKIHEYFLDDISRAEISPSRHFILAVEDARLLGVDINRLDYLAACGVKILTLTWSGSSCIGGAFDTTDSLTDFGEQVVKRCFELSIVPDISHASRHTAERVFELNTLNKPIIASHSDAFSVHQHPRNLTDDEFIKIKDCQGLVGINLYCEHLGIAPDSPKDIEKVIEHIEHYLSLGGEDTIAFGCDFDGALTTSHLKSISDLYLIADKMAMLGYTDKLIEKIFSKNAEIFISKNF